MIYAPTDQLDRTGRRTNDELITEHCGIALDLATVGALTDPQHHQPAHLDLPPSRACTVEVSELVTIAPGVTFTRTYRVIRSSHTPSQNPNITTKEIK